MIRKLLFFTICLFFFFAFSLSFYADAATETFHQTYQVKPGTLLEVSNKNGPIEIRRWEESYVKVFAEKKTNWGGRLDQVEIQVNTDDVMTIETVYLVKNPRVSVRYDIRVPEAVMVTAVNTSNGKIELEGTQGDATIKTSNGKIVIEDVRGDMKAKTSNGTIEIDGVKGTVRAETSNGSIKIHHVEGIEQAETSNGSIEAEIPTIFDNIRIKTSNGSIKLRLAPNLQANIDMKTSNGKITLHDVEIIAREISKNQVKGRLGDGGPEIIVKTSNGSIAVYPLQ